MLFGEPNTCVLTRNTGVSDCDLHAEDNVCLVPDCLFEMQIQLIFVFVLKTTGKQLWEFISPSLLWMISQLFLLRTIIKDQVEANKNAEHDDVAAASDPAALGESTDTNATSSGNENDTQSSTHLSEIEKIAAQPRFKGTNDEYLTLMIQFGCIGFFASALPIVPVLAMVSNIIELRGDAHKFTHQVRRPPITNAEGIGTFGTILDTLALGAVIMNAAIIGLVMTVVAEWFYPGGGVGHSVAERMEIGKLWMAVVLLEHVMLSSVAIVRRAVPAEPGWLEDAKLRQKLYISKVVTVSVKQLFEEIDLDASGSLDKSEVAVLCERLGKRFNDGDGPTLDEIMGEMTTESQSSTVRLEEFEAWWKRTMGPR